MLPPGCRTYPGSASVGTAAVPKVSVNSTSMTKVADGPPPSAGKPRYDKRQERRVPNRTGIAQPAMTQLRTGSERFTFERLRQTAWLRHLRRPF
jgi:hypothetical protein